MAFATDTSGHCDLPSGTSGTVDITTAAVGAWVYLWVTLIGSITVPAAVTGWTAIVTDSPNAVVLKRKKLSGDTTFTVSWTGSAQGVGIWASFTGLDPTTQEEAAAITDSTTPTRTAVPTPTCTPGFTGRVGLAFFSVRTTTSANKAITWSPDPATTEIIDYAYSAAAVSPWVGAEIAITTSSPSTAPIQYTASHNFTETRDFSALMFLIPAATIPPANAKAGFFDGV